MCYQINKILRNINDDSHLYVLSIKENFKK